MGLYRFGNQSMSGEYKLYSINSGPTIDFSGLWGTHISFGCPFLYKQRCFFGVSVCHYPKRAIYLNIHSILMSDPSIRNDNII